MTRRSSPARAALAVFAATVASSVHAAEPPKNVPPAPAVDLRMLEAQASMRDRKPGDIRKRADAELTTLLKDFDAATVTPADLDLLTRLTVLREYAALVARLGRIEGPERDTALWLLGRERLLTTLMCAVGPEDAPDSVLRVVSQIRLGTGDRADEFPDLAAALAVVYDSFSDMSGEGAAAPDAKQVARLFAYYTNARSRMRFDPQTLPWQLAVFVVDTNVAEDELAWALTRYATRPVLKDAYYDVRYDDDPTYTAAPGKPSGSAAPSRRYGRVIQDNGRVTDPTLEQLARSGGSTRAQAHFAVAVCRALGVPAAAILGVGESGTVRSWIGVMEVKDGRCRFDLTVGRQDEQQRWPGQLLDPQTHDLISEEELTLLCELQSTPPKARNTSSALTKLALLGETSPDVVPPEARTKLLLKAVELSPGNRQAWAALRKLGTDSQLTASDLDKILPLLGKTIVPRYPGVALEILRDVISWRGSREQLATIDRLAPTFQSRPDLQLRLFLLKGDLHADAGQHREALAAWLTVVERPNDAGPYAIDAMQRIDKLLRDRKDGRLLLSTYDRVWTRMPAPRSTGLVQATAYYQIGQSYASLLEESGEKTKADNIRQRLDTLLSANTPTPIRGGR